jgi:chromosome segregation ATPase
MAKSLKKRIDELINALGSADKPTYPQIKSRLIRFSALAEQLEEGKAIRKLESKIATLETALEESNEKNLLLDVQIKEANYEIDRFRAEEEQREKKETELPDIQFEILERLPSQHGGLGLTVPQIWREINGFRLDEIEIHVDKLEKAGLISWHMEADGEKFWRRSMPGNELVVAKRLAGE